MALSMIVEMTSETPRLTLSQAAMPAQRPPATIATRMATITLSDARQPGLAGEDRGREDGDAVLAVDADVEEVHPEADGDGDGGEVEDASRR